MTTATLVAAAPLRIGARGTAVYLLQDALRASGAELARDGDFGTQTQKAIKRFEGTYGLKVDGIVDPTVAKMLDDLLAKAPKKPPAPLPSTLAIAPWLSTMRAISGTKEVPGPKDNPLILGFAKEIGVRYPDMAAYCASYTHDSIAWCGLMLAYAMAINGIKPPKEFLWVDNFRTWGQKLDEPTPGAILTFSRSGGNHGTIYESETATHWYIRGGNQTDMVNVSPRAKSQGKPTGIRWPPGIPLPTTGRKMGATSNAAAGGKES